MKIIVIAILASFFSLFLTSNFTHADSTEITVADVIEISIKGVISNPKFYDGKKIAVEGEVEQVHHTTAFSGDPYTLFRMHDNENNELGVYSKGNLSITEGSKIKVTGVFTKEKSVAFLKFKNVIKAKQVEETS